MNFIQLLKRDFYFLKSKKRNLFFLLSFFTLLFIHLKKNLTDLAFFTGGITEMSARESLFISFPYCWFFIVLAPIILIHDFIRQDLTTQGIPVFILAQKKWYLLSKIIASFLATLVLNILYFLILHLLTIPFSLFFYLLIFLGQLMSVSIFILFNLLLEEILAFIVIIIIYSLGWKHSHHFFPANINMPAQHLSNQLTTSFILSYNFMFFFISSILSIYILQKKEIY
ncbi:MAG TPA: hypothetical protein DIS85_03475 [Vagococcus sp.]|uniref:Uncharacterized protein n=2 Tax=Enterococcaceae TaxID=81852 RepID=A0A1X6WRP1_9ENTE|nr:hypothetical protein FM121_12635 [Vagococcus fluvialis bH819]HCM88940.1 hypothetical protein [Vagococcus sp.]